MPACNKDAFIDDFVVEPDKVQQDYIEETYNVSVHSTADGGLSHIEERHGHTLTKEDLAQRFSKKPDLPAATKFDSREGMWASRHRWLEAFASEMHGVDHPQNGQPFSKTLRVPDERVGSGIMKDGREISGIENVTFAFEWDAVRHIWREVSGYPDAVNTYVDRVWKKV